MKASDKEEFLEAYKNIHEPLMRFCIVKSRGIMDPKDLANDVLLVALEKYSDLKDKKALLSYLFTTANNISLNRLRRKKFSGTYNETFANNIPDGSINIESRVDINILYEAMNQLPALQKEAVILFEISDLPIKEIMAIQNAGESSVKQRIKRGREKLAAIMEGKNHKKKVVAIPIILTTNAFSMSNLDQYFEAIKMMPLPISKADAMAEISNFQLPVQTPTKSKLSDSILKSKVMGAMVIGIGMLSIILLSGSSISEFEPSLLEKKTMFSSILPSEPSDQIKTATIEKNDQPIINKNEHQNVSFLATSLEENQSIDSSVLSKSNIATIPINWKGFKDVVSSQKNQLITTPNKKELVSVTESSLINGDSKTFDLNGVVVLEINDIGEEIDILTWDRNEIKIEQTIVVESKKEKDETIITNNIKLLTQKIGNRFILKNSSKKKRTSTIQLGNLSQKTIEFENGQKAKYKKLSRSYVITIPKKMNLKLDNRYANINMAALEGDLSGKIYESKLNTENIIGDVKMSLRYSKVLLGSFNSGKLEIYETDLEFNDCENLELNSKYSDINGQQIQSLTLNSYEDDIVLSRNNSMSGQLKYSSLKCEGNITKIDMQAYESKLYAKNVRDVNLSSFSYSLLDIDKIEHLKVTKTYESKLIINELDDISVETSKYTDYIIGKLTKEALISSYEDNLSLSHILADFKQLKFDGKYTKYNLSLDDNSDYEIDIKTHYGSLDYSKLSISETNLKEKGNNVHLSGFSRNKTNSSLAKIKFDCYESSIFFK